MDHCLFVRTYFILIIGPQDLLVKSSEVTRSIVQKAVVVLARQPIFGPIRQKLAVITAAWFNEKDFTKLDILYVSLMKCFLGHTKPITVTDK
jgi:hypothetical protein